MIDILRLATVAAAATAVALAGAGCGGSRHHVPSARASSAPAGTPAERARAAADLRVLRAAAGRDACAVTCQGGAALPEDAATQAFARDTACAAGLAQNLLLALLDKEHQQYPAQTQKEMVAAGIDKSLGVASMKYGTATDLIRLHHRAVPEAADRTALVARLVDDPRLDIQLAADRLADARHAGLGDRGAFVAYAFSPGNWPALRAAGDSTAAFSDDHTPGRESARQRAADYDYLTGVLAAADDWLALPAGVRAATQGHRRLTLPYAAPRRPDCA
ncbi:MAG: hypothetical protein ACJ73S_09465 [Mycobacteriales bacterium]